MVVAFVTVGGAVLLFRRSESEEILAGMWELPSVSARDSFSSAAASMSRRYGGQWRFLKMMKTVEHRITNRLFKMTVHSALFEAGDSIAEGPEAAWVSIDDMRDFPVSSMVHKVVGGS